jgi:hypothetical protein
MTEAIHKPSGPVSIGLPGRLSFHGHRHDMVVGRSRANLDRGKRQGQAAKVRLARYL